jgi:hypothetical protein
MDIKNKVKMGVEEDNQKWHKITVSLQELCIDTVLRCGQSFRYGGCFFLREGEEGRAGRANVIFRWKLLGDGGVGAGEWYDTCYYPFLIDFFDFFDFFFGLGEMGC